MSYNEKAQASLREAASRNDPFPYGLLTQLVSAIVWALLAIAVAIETKGDDR